MKLPVGVTLSAIGTLLGSFLMSALFLLISAVLFFSLLSRGQPPLPPEAKVGMGLGLVMFGALSVWGIVTAIGLFRLRNWARISILVFGVLLAFTGLFSAPVMAVMPTPPGLPENFKLVRIAMAVFYGVLGLLGAVWVYYFSRRATRDAFSGAAAPAEGGRPLSISIIGWWFVIGGALAALCALLRPPGALFLWVFTGWAAAAWYVAYGALSACVGYGLLKLDPRARGAAIAMTIFGAVNLVVFYTFPGSSARLAAVTSGWTIFVRTTPQLETSPLVLMLPVLAGMAVILWFLTSRKAAFQRGVVAPTA